MKNITIGDFVAVLFTLIKIVKSGKIRKKQIEIYVEFFENRMIRNKEQYKTSQSIIQSYEFVKKILDKIATLI